MSNVLKSKILLGTMIVAAAFVGAMMLAQTADAAYMHTVTLRQGSSGAQVMALQTTLGGLAVDGNFGPMTKAAVMAYQASRGLVADGVVGPMTGASLAGVMAGGTFPAGCSSASGYSVTTGLLCSGGSTLPAGCMPGYFFSSTTGASCTGGAAPAAGLTGGAGSIEDADFVSSLSGEEVGEDTEDVKVLGLDIDADDGSDLRLTAVRLDFTQGTADQDFEDYGTEVSVWFEGEEVARADADGFNDDNNFDKTLTLSGDAVIEAGGTGELVVAVSGVGNLDSNDDGETWTLEVESVRFEDASGAIITDDATGDINGVTRQFTFELFATATDAELQIAEQTGSAAEAINTSHMINVHATDTTDNVKILAFTLEAEGTSDLEIREFGVDLVTSAADVDDVIDGGTSPAVKLIIDGQEYGTASYNEVAANNREILFDDVDYVLDAGDKVNAFIEVDFLSVAGALTEGDTILAQLLETQTDDAALVDVRDESGEQLVDGDITGTATGEANQLYDVTFTLDTDGWDNDPVIVGGFAGEDDEVTFNLAFTVTAVDGDVYIDNTCTEDADGTLVIGDAPDGFNFSQTDGTDASIALTCSYTTDGATAPTADWLVSEGETETFRVAIRAIADVGDSFVQVAWEGLGWNETDAAGDRLFEGSLDDVYKSNSISLNQR